MSAFKTKRNNQMIVNTTIKIKSICSDQLKVDEKMVHKYGELSINYTVFNEFCKSCLPLNLHDETPKQLLTQWICHNIFDFAVPIIWAGTDFLLPHTCGILNSI